MDCHCNVGYTGTDGATCVVWHEWEWFTFNTTDHNYITTFGRDPWNINIQIQVGNVDLPNQNPSCAVGINSSKLADETVSFSLINCEASGRYVYVVLAPTGASRMMSIQEIEVHSTPQQCGCRSCVSDIYKISTGSVTCTNCGANFYSTGLTAPNNTCLTCPAGSQSTGCSDTLLDSTCKTGYTGKECTTCPAGKYKTQTGSVTCLDCPIDTFWTGAGKTDATCTSCSDTTTGPSRTVSTGSSTVTVCRCDLGYTGANGVTCTACTTDKYKESQGSDACSFCPEDTYQPSTARTTYADCTTCPTSVVSLVGSPALTSCQCSSGYADANGGACTACYAGQYKTLKGPQACSVCPNATYSGVFNATVNVTCTICPAHSLVWEGSIALTDCHCDTGYYTEGIGLSNVTCTICTPPERTIAYWSLCRVRSARPDNTRPILEQRRVKPVSRV